MNNFFHPRRVSGLLHPWRVLAVLQVQSNLLHSDGRGVWGSAWCSRADCVPVCSKEESGFLAVPMAQNGVVTVAVDYDIAPKGVSPFE